MAIGFILKIVFLGVAVGAVFVGKKVFHLKDDNLIEEVSEEILKEELNVDIDLTPETPEKDEPSLLVKEISQTVVDNIDKI